MTTKVLYKMLDDEVIALFPREPGDMNAYRTCLSYMHNGQHSAASLELCANPTARPDQYAPLHAELESLGYHLTVGKRATRADLRARIHSL